MQAVGACMRKLVMLSYGVLKHRLPFDPAYGSRIVTGQHATWFGGQARGHGLNFSNVLPLNL